MIIQRVSKLLIRDGIAYQLTDRPDTIYLSWRDAFYFAREVDGHPWAYVPYPRFLQESERWKRS